MSWLGEGWVKNLDKAKIKAFDLNFKTAEVEALMAKLTMIPTTTVKMFMYFMWTDYLHPSNLQAKLLVRHLVIGGDGICQFCFRYF